MEGTADKGLQGEDPTRHLLPRVSNSTIAHPLPISEAPAQDHSQASFCRKGRRCQSNPGSIDSVSAL